MSTFALPKLYGVPLSQPFRSVAWALLQRQVPFEVQVVVPGATNAMGSRHESFARKTHGRSTKIPVYEENLPTENGHNDNINDNNNNNNTRLTISESPAILIYLCESRGWTDWYPSSSESSSSSSLASRILTKTRIDSYLHWHHAGTRELMRLTRPYLRPEEGKAAPTDEDRAAAQAVWQQLEQGWLNHDKNNEQEVHPPGPFIAGTPSPTIADLLAYEEVVQATVLSGLDWSSSQDEYPHLTAWMDHMRQLPYYDVVHAGLYRLGNLVDTSSTDKMPLGKRLAVATKEGLKAIQDAQQNYSSRL